MKEKMHPLKKWRIKNGMTIPELARALEVGEANLYRWENGDLPRPGRLRRLVEFTGGEVTLDEFIDFAADQKAREGGK